MPEPHLHPTAPNRLTPEVSERIKLVSLVCSVLVCFGHSYLVPLDRSLGDGWMTVTIVIEGTVKHGLARVSTPFFFLIAAWLLTQAILGRHDGWWLVDGARYRSEIAKRVRSLIVPFAIWSGLSFAFMLLVQALWPGLRLQSIADASVSQVARWLVWDPVAYPLWFVRNLFALAVLSPLLLVLLAQRKIGLVVLGGLMATWFVFPDAQATRSALFFSAGIYAAVHRVSLPRPSDGMRLALPLLWLLTAGTLAWTRATAGPDSAALRNLGVLLGLASLWWSLPILGWMRTKPVTMATGFTFFVYVFHEPFASIAKAVVRPLVGNDPSLVLAGWVVVGSLTFTVAVLVGIIWERWLPVSYGIVSGGRAIKRGPDSRAKMQTAA